MTPTKEKLVFAVALVVALLSFAGIRKPATEDLPKIPPEESPRPPRVTVPIPALHPEKPLDPGARDPFVSASAWVAAKPARLGALPVPAETRFFPGGAFPGMRGGLVPIDHDPAPVEEPDAPAPPANPPSKEGGDK